MTKAFNRIAITKDEDAQTKFRSQVRLKQRHISDLHQYIKQFITAPEQNALQGNFYNTFVDMFLAKYQSEFPPISVHKMLEAMEVDIKLIDTLTKQIAGIDIDLDENMKPTEPDFNIYTESEEQNKLYKALEKVCIDLKTLHTMGVRLSPSTLMQGTSNALVYDWATQQMKPNLRRVLGTERG